MSLQSRGTLYIISAPSGGGKTSLVHALLAQDKQIQVSVSHTTRAPRKGEENGKNYYFIDETEFHELKKSNKFLESAEVFGHWYGTSKEWVETSLEAGIDVILEIDWQGARRIRDMLACVSIFILPPSRQILQERLEARAQDESAEIHRRMEQASQEISHYGEYDYLIVNDEFEEAVKDLTAIVRARRKRLAQQRDKYSKLIQDLLS